MTWPARRLSYSPRREPCAGWPAKGEHEDGDPTALRFGRIEATLETLANTMAGIAVTQQKVGEAQLRTEYALTEAVENMDREHKRLLTAQVILADDMRKLAEAQAKSEIAQAETQGKFDALIQMWDESIRERGAKNGAPEPPPSPSGASTTQ